MEISGAEVAGNNNQERILKKILSFLLTYSGKSDIIKIKKVLNDVERLIGYINQPLWENWYIDKKIGQGTYSEIYRIYSGDSVSALKVKPVFAGGLEEVDRKLTVALKEADIMHTLKECQYITEYQDCIIQKVSGLQYLVMIRMEILSPLTEQGTHFPENIVRKIALDIGKALEYIHSSGIVHCDVKPDNFFVAPDGKYKLGDFNISGYAGNRRYISGTFGYTAPEVYNNPVYDSRSDIYSFGKSLENLADSVSPDFSAIIGKACTESLYERYRTVTEMLTDILIKR